MLTRANAGHQLHLGMPTVTPAERQPCAAMRKTSSTIPKSQVISPPKSTVTKGPIGKLTSHSMEPAHPKGTDTEVVQGSQARRPSSLPLSLASSISLMILAVQPDKSSVCESGSTNFRKCFTLEVWLSVGGLCAEVGAGPRGRAAAARPREQCAETHSSGAHDSELTR